TAALTLGTHSITATYSGDGALDPASSTTYVPAVAEVVGQASTTTVASAGTPEPGVVSQPLTFNAAVSVDAPGGGTPTGTVAFKTDGVNIVGCETRPLVAGAATCTTTGLTWGGQGITAVYSGDANNTTSGSTEFLFTVEAAGTTTAVTSSDLTTSWTDPVTYTATISPVSPATLAPGTGTVSFKIGGTPITSCTAQAVSAGVATCLTGATPVGAESITAVYTDVLNIFSGSNYSASTSPAIVQTVSRAAATTALVSDHNPSRFGQAVTLTATVTSTAGTPTGTVSFFVVLSDTTHQPIATVSLVAGAASTTTAALPVHNGSVIAEYNGDANFAASTHTTPQTVQRSLSRTLMTSSDKTSTIGQAVTFRVTVASDGTGSGTPTGLVALYMVRANGSRQWIGRGNLRSGVTFIVVPGIPMGPHKIVAEYRGTMDFRPSSRSMTQTVSA
ncbi:MAG: Ig-like domain-containing protein, partial [Acidimicrobiia bacterium]